jgi:PPK2 family polyphosphate:nucleotide phosphotransferase
MLERHRIAPGSKVHLGRLDAGSSAGFKGGKARTADVFADLNARLHALQEKLWAEHRRKVLVVLQGMDTSGKDGTVSHVFEGVNPLGVKVVAWKAPNSAELDHDFLWRIHAQVPGAGEITIFNRSHYESVLVERVHDLVPREVWKARFAQINDFERLLVESGTTVLKFYLHIDRDEQKKRLQQRLDDPAKHWKLCADDFADRRRWDDYMAAYEEAIHRTSTPHAPWYVVPANRKWYRNLVVAEVLVRALEGLDLRYRDAPAELLHIEFE